LRRQTKGRRWGCSAAGEEIRSCGELPERRPPCVGAEPACGANKLLHPRARGSAQEPGPVSENQHVVHLVASRTMTRAG
jgi:hypothetical protein